MSDALNVETAEIADAATESQNLNSDETNANSDPVETPNKDSNSEKTFTQADVNRIAKREAEKARQAALKEIQDKAAEAEMTESQKATARAEKAERELAAERRERLVDRVANSEFAKLPVEAREELRDRLRGETEEELRKDAKKLAKFAAPVRPEAPNLNSQNGGQASLLDSPEAKRAAASLTRGF